MKTLKNILTVFFFTLSLHFSNAQNAVPLENSMLWKVEHPDLEKPSYIFGTLHMMCPDDFKMPEKIERTIASVDALVLEINMSDPEEIKELQASMTSTQKISEELSESQFNQLDTLVQRIVGMPLANLDAYGLSMLNMILITKMLPCSELKSFEAELIQIAQNKEMPISGLETAKEQIANINAGYPTAFSFQQLMLHDAYKKDFTDAIVAYNKELLNLAVSYISKPAYMNENAVNYLQVDRNKNWVAKMPQMMKERSNLFAVGAAHLTNDFGLIHLLREKGYTVSPVFN